MTRTRAKCTNADCGWQFTGSLTEAIWQAWSHELMELIVNLRNPDHQVSLTDVRKGED